MVSHYLFVFFIFSAGSSYLENEARPGGGTKTTNTTNDGTTRSKKKANIPYNPYARVNRRKPSNKETCEITSSANAGISGSTARMISPLPETSNNASPHSFEIRHEKRRINDRRSNSPPPTLTKRRKQTHVRSKRGRPSRRFGESSFRAPREQSVMSSSGLSTSNENDQDIVEQNKQRVSPVLKDLEDTDEDEDDLSWLNATPFLSKRR